ncbi:MAG: hypothetical protein WEC14_08635 [Chloroflexota bacterium]
MIGLLFIAVTAAFGAFAWAALRWGVDSRTWTTDGRPMTIIGTR